jgi:hypothetical protein
MQVPRGLKIAAGLISICAWYVVNLACPIETEEYSMPPLPVLGTNTLLRKALQVSRPLLDGPEALAFRGKFIFSGLADGRIVVLDTEFNQVCLFLLAFNT